MIRKLAKAAVAVTAVIPLLLAATPGSASARHDGNRWACWKFASSVTNGGCGTFWPHDEVVVVRDWNSDGWGTRAQIQKLLPNSQGVMQWVNHSSNCFDDTSTSNSWNGGTACNYAIAEGIVVRLHVWASRNGETRHHIYTDTIRS